MTEEHPMQDLIDELSKGWRAQRSLSQMTLQQLIQTLEKLDGKLLITGLGEVGSYRGYYSDLSFTPTSDTRTVAQLLEDCRRCLGATFTGYKGREFYMDEHTPLWVSPYGATSEVKLMGLDLAASPIQPVTEQEEW